MRAETVNWTRNTRGSVQTIRFCYEWCHEKICKHMCSRGVRPGRPAKHCRRAECPLDILPHGTISPRDFASCKRSLPPLRAECPPTLVVPHMYEEAMELICIAIMTACLGLEKIARRVVSRTRLSHGESLACENETSPWGHFEGGTSTP